MAEGKHYRVILMRHPDRIFLVSEEHDGPGRPPHKSDVSECTDKCTSFVVFLLPDEARMIGANLIQQADEMEFGEQKPQ